MKRKIGDFGFAQETEQENPCSECNFMGLSPSNTISDFITELYDGMFRDILGNETMDRALGSFDRHELLKVMSRIFLQDGNYKIYEQLVNN